MSKRTLILFDNGGVLTRMNFSPVFALLSQRTGMPVSELKRKLGASRATEQGILGNVTEYFRRYREAIDPALTNDDIIAFETAMSLPGPIDDMVALKKRLSTAGYTVGILSNSFPFVIEWQKREWKGTLDTFGGPAIYSHEVGCIKPDPRIYALVPRFEKVIYIEDKSAYLKYPVEHLGWTGILLTGFQDENEPIRAEGHGEQIVQGMHIAHSPHDVESLLRTFGLTF